MILLLYLYSRKILPLLIKVSNIESKRIAIDIISNDISSDIIKVLEENDLFIIEKDINGNIELIDYNTKTVNKILLIASNQVSKNFNNLKLKKDGIVMRIPMGALTNNIFLENLGPKVPIKLELNGNALTSLDTNVKEYGLNSALIEVFINIEANIDVIVPFKTSEIRVINKIPISIKVVKGNVSNILNTDR